MKFVIFSLCFTIIHALAYTIAGAISFRISKELYESKSRLMDYLRDMSNESEKKVVEKRFFPSQLVRGLLMSVVLYPLLAPLSNLSLIIRFTFFTSLMFIFTHFSSAAPCPDNIEGFIYMQKRYFSKSSFFKFQFEMLLYSMIFALLLSWIFFELF